VNKVTFSTFGSSQFTLQSLAEPEECNEASLISLEELNNLNKAKKEPSKEEGSGFLKSVCSMFSDCFNCFGRSEDARQHQYNAVTQ